MTTSPAAIAAYPGSVLDTKYYWKNTLLGDQRPRQKIVAYRYFATPKRKFIIADTPGHVQYTRNMVTGASTANLAIILGAIAFGGVIGAVVARRIKMTAMPQLVSFFNATGGAASALVALIEFSNPDNQSGLVTLLGMIIGSIAFSGSMIAYGKLNGNVKDIFSKWMTYINLVILAGVLFLLFFVLFGGAPAETNQTLVYILLAVSLVYGVSFVMPIGGADMPVVISLLNSFTPVSPNNCSLHHL